MIKNDPTKVIKVPSNSFRIANENCELKNYVFWLKLKSLNVEGVIVRGTIAQTAKYFGLGISMFRNYLKRLLDLGWLVKDKLTYQIISYNKLWHKFGFEFKKNGKGLVKETIFKIDVNQLDQLENQIIVHEIKKNFKQQEKQIEKKYAAQYISSDTGSTKIKKQLISKINYKRCNFYQFINVRKNFMLSKSVLKINFDISISCLKLAQLLGYQTAMSGHLIEQRLQKYGYIEVKNRKLLVIRNITQDAFNNLDLPSNFLYRNGNLYKQLTNSISFV